MIAVETSRYTYINYTCNTKEKKDFLVLLTLFML